MSGRFVYGLVLGSVLLQASVSSIAIAAEEGSDSWYGQSVFERPREDYKSDGVRVRSFKITPGVKLEETYDTNIYADDGGEVDDYITKVKPAIGIESDWSRHAIGFNASGNIGTYADRSHENFNDFSIGTSGRLDVLRETYITALADYSKLHEDRGSPDAALGSQEPTEYSKSNAGLSFTRNLRKFSLKVDGGLSDFNYDDGINNTGGLINNDDRDRKQYSTSAKVGYEIIPEYQAFIKTTLNERDYNDIVDDGGVNRDSSGYEVVGGTALNLGGKTKGEIFAGFMEQDYDSPALKDAEGAQYGADVLWNATGITSVKFGVVRGIEETTTANASSYISTEYSIGVEHELRQNILLGLDVSHSLNEYETSDSLAREDRVDSIGGEVRYLFNRRVSAVGGYNFSARDSNIVGQDYERSLITVGLKLEM